MTHLRIELNTTPEIVTSDVIHKLYETAKAIIDAEEANEVEESLVSLKGNLLVSKAYGDEIDWLEVKFPDLHITAGARYIRFADSAVLSRLLLYLGDGTGITSSEITNANIFSKNTDPNTGRYRFVNNTDVVSFNELVQLPQVTTIPPLAFEGATNLTSIDLSHIEEVGWQSFRGTNLTGVINLPNIIRFVNNNSSTNGGAGSTFYGCKNITEVNLGESLLYFNTEANFKDCTNLTKVTGLLNITSIPSSTFSGCTKLASVDTSSNLTAVGAWGFSNCSSLTSIDLSSCTSIGDSAFGSCSSLQSVDLSSCTSIGLNGFANCKSLTSITLNPTQSVALSSETFSSCENLTTINNSNNISVINEYTFNRCYELTSLDLSGLDFTNSNVLDAFHGDPYRERSLFYQCEKLTTLGITSIPITKLGQRTFVGCASLQGELNFPNLTTNTGGDVGNSRLFQHCSSLTKISFGHIDKIHSGSSVDSNDNAMFYRCTSLKIVDLGDSITEIGIYAFRECSSLAAVIINKSVPPAIVYLGDSSNASSYTLDLVFGNSSVNIYVPDAAVDTYKSTTPYSNFTSHIKALSTYNESTILGSQN